ncbi:MAG: hypothetical protein J6X70_11220 [Muribaculaceae bacterium]|nr:hypothetical protein [Muribaculaceae bacterium]
MKKLIAIFMLTLLWGASMASAQNLRDGDYNYIGKISPNGTVRDAKYNALGFFNPDGTIANAHNKLVGTVTKDLQILDKDGQRIGFVTVEGEVRDGESHLLGTIDRSTGKVTDADGKVVGYANGISMLWIAAYYFFPFFQ